MNAEELYQEAQRVAGGCETLEELRQAVALYDRIDEVGFTTTEFALWTERAWQESRGD